MHPALIFLLVVLQSCLNVLSSKYQVGGMTALTEVFERCDLTLLTFARVVRLPVAP